HSIRVDAGGAMTRERERELKQLARLFLKQWSENYAKHGDLAKLDWSGGMAENMLAKFALEIHPTEKRLGREDADSVYWPALREQWRIEFGRELKQEGGHIMNIVDSVRELVREEREKVLADFRTVRPNI